LLQLVGSVADGAAVPTEAPRAAADGVGAGAGGGPLAVPGAVQVIGDVAGVGVDGGRDLREPFSGLVGAQPGRVVRGFERWHDRVPFGSDRDDVA